MCKKCAFYKRLIIRRLQGRPNRLVFRFSSWLSRKDGGARTSQTHGCGLSAGLYRTVSPRFSATGRRGTHGRSWRSATSASTGSSDRRRSPSGGAAPTRRRSAPRRQCSAGATGWRHRRVSRKPAHAPTASAALSSARRRSAATRSCPCCDASQQQHDDHGQ